MVQVIAHFHDLQGAFQAVIELLSPKGYLLVETWNKDSLVAKALGKGWHEYSPPSVLHWFSPSTLKQLLTPLGFHEVAHGRPLST